MVKNHNMTVYKKRKSTVTKSKLIHNIKKWCKKQKEDFIPINKKQQMVNINKLLAHGEDIYKDKTDEYIEENTTVEELTYYIQYYTQLDNEDMVIKYCKVVSKKNSANNINSIHVANACKKLGMLYENKKDFENMKFYYNLVGDGWSAVRMGLYYMGENDIHNMKRYFEIGMEKNEVDAFVELGVYYLNQHNYVDMMQCFMGGLIIDPNNASLLFYVGYYYSEIKNKQYAIKYFKLAAKNNHESARIHLGLYYMECGDYDTALHFLMEGDINSSKTHVRVGRCKFLMKEYKEAKKYYKLACENNNLSVEYIDLLKSYIDEYLDMGFDMEFAYECERLLSSKHKKKLEFGISSHIQIMKSSVINI